MLAGCAGKSGSVVIGTKDYTEQYILGNLLALLIEKNTNISTTVKVDLGSDILFSGIVTDTIDIYVEYTGTVFANHLNFYDNYFIVDEVLSAEEIYNLSKSALMQDYNVLMLDKLGFNNTYALAIRSEISEMYDILTISELAVFSPDMVFGGSSEILRRSDGIPNLKIVYDMHFKSEIIIDVTERYSSIANDEVQVVEAFSTDGMLNEYSLVVLEDDLHFFPPYHAVPLIRNDIAQEFPEIVKVLDKLSGILTDDIMRNLNYRVDVNGENPRDVAESFLRENNLIR